MRCLPLSFAPWLLLATACSGSEPVQEQGMVAPFGSPMATPPAPGEMNAAPPATNPPPAPGASGNEGTPMVGGLTPTPATPPADTGGGEMPAAPVDMAMDPMTPPDPVAPGFPPSQGCGSANPPSGAASLALRGAQADYLVTLPANYDANTPTPLIFAFHGRNRTHVQLQTVDAGQIQTELGSRAVMAYLKSQGGSGWNAAAEVEPNVEFFEALYPQLLASYCIDTAQIFAVGHSSGGYFSEILACRFGDRLRGIGAVAGQQQERNCNSGRVAALLVHGTTDTVVPFAGGMSARDFYLSRNGCDNASVAGAVSPCIAYQNCDAGLPVEWCQHTEPTYSDQAGPTNHGWPSFASRAISQFFFSLPPRSE